MKGFDEFWSTEFTPEESERLAQIVADTIRTECKQLSAEEPLPRGAAVLILNSKANIRLTQEILRKYHDWLSSQL